MALLGLAFFVSGCSENYDIEQISGNVLGYEYRVEFLPAHPNHTENRVSQRVQGIMQYVAMQFSVEYPQSEVNRLNRWESTDAFVLTRELEGLIRQSLHLRALSEGGIELFHADIATDQAPVRIQNHQLIKSDASVTVELDSLLRGHMADRIADILDLMNVQTYRVEIDNQLRLRSPKRRGQYQRVEFIDIESFYLNVRDGAVASAFSADESNIERVIVLHENAAEAEGLARWFAQLSLEESLSAANQHNVSVVFFVREDSGLTRYNSSAFANEVL
nr:FAD:protein FMN transferase [Aliidiomarina indica]